MDGLYMLDYVHGLYDLMISTPMSEGRKSDNQLTEHSGAILNKLKY